MSHFIFLVLVSGFSFLNSPLTRNGQRQVAVRGPGEVGTHEKSAASICQGLRPEAQFLNDHLDILCIFLMCFFPPASSLSLSTSYCAPSLFDAGMLACYHWLF